MTCIYLWPHVIGNFGQIPLVVFTGVAMLISIPGNILTGYVIIQNETLRTEPAYLLIYSVCLADTIVSTITQPLFITTTLLGTRASCYLDNTYFTFAWISSVSSALGVSIITFDRYLYIVHPLHYAAWMTQRRAIVLIVVVWVTAILFGTLPLLWHNTMALHTITLTLLILISIFMAYTYGRVYLKIRSSSEPPMPSGMVTKTKARSQSQATRTVLFVVLAFFGCWYPWSIITFVMALHDSVSTLKSFQATSYVVKLHWIFLAFGYFNSALNVFIYSRKNTVLRTAIAKFVNWNSTTTDANIVVPKSHGPAENMIKPHTTSINRVILKDSEKDAQSSPTMKNPVIEVDDINCNGDFCVNSLPLSTSNLQIHDNSSCHSERLRSQTTETILSLY